MENHGLPQDFVVNGSVPIVVDGITIGERVYVRGDRHEVAAYGTHTRLLNGDQTGSQDVETVVDMMETHGQSSDYFFG